MTKLYINKHKNPCSCKQLNSWVFSIFSMAVCKSCLLYWQCCCFSQC